MRSKDYSITIWADGFGIWHGQATYTIPLGNTGEADRVWNNSRLAVKRAIRKEIMARSPYGAKFQVRLKNIRSSHINSGNQLLSFEWSE